MVKFASFQGWGSVFGVAVAMLLPVGLAGAPVFETFTGLTTAEQGNYTFNNFTITAGWAEPDLAWRIDGTSVRLTPNAGSALAYVGPGGAGKVGGVGTVSFDWRAWNDAYPVNYNLQYRVGAGAWTTFSSIQTPGGGPSQVASVQSFSHDLNMAGDNVQVRVVWVSGDRFIIDNFGITDYTAPAFDPGVQLSDSSLNYGLVDLFERKTVGLTVANSGSSEFLTVDGEIVGADGAVYSILTSLPLSIAPGMNEIIEVQFSSPVIVGAYDDAVLRLYTNSENAADEVIDVALSGSVADAVSGSPLGILDDYTGGTALVYTYDTQDQFAVSSNQLVGVASLGTGPEHSYVSTDLAAVLPGWELSTTKANKWIGWMRLARNPSGWGTDSYGVGAVLACDRGDFNHASAQGYAVVTRGGTPRAVSLIRFTQGIRDGATDLPAGATQLASVEVDPLTTGINYHVEIQANGTWRLMVFHGNAFTEEQALNTDNYTTGAGFSSSDSLTFSGADFRYAGWVWAHGNSPNEASRGFFDNLGAGFSGASDSSALVIDTIARLDPVGGISAGGTVSWTVAFNKPIMPASLSAGDFELVVVDGEDGGASIAGVSFVDYDMVRVYVSTGTGNKTLGLRVPASAGMTDRFGNVYNTLSESVSNFVVDQSIPEISISVPSVSITNDGPVVYTLDITGAESVNLTAAGIELVATGTADATVDVSGSGLLERTVTLSSITGDGELSIRVGAGAAESLAGNPSAQSDVSTSVLVDNTVPTVTAVSPSANSTLSSLTSIQVSFSEAVSGVTAGALTIDGQPSESVSGSGIGPYTFGTPSGLSDGAISIELTGTGIVDAAGNPVVDADWSYTLNASKVSALLSSATVSNDGATSVSPVLLTLELSEAVVNVPAGAFSGSGYTLGGLTGSGSVYTLEILPSAEGLVVVNLDAETLTAVAAPGNGNLSAGFQFLHDVTAPLVDFESDVEWVIAGDVVIDYAAADSLSGVSGARLYVSGPGEESFEAAAVSSSASGSLVYTPLVSGVHRFAVSATDAAGNTSAVDPSGAVSVLVNMNENGPLVLPVPLGVNVEIFFPLAAGVSVRAIFDSVTVAGTLSAQRLVGSGDAGLFALDPARLAGQFYRLISGGGLVFGTATLEFVVDESLLGGAVSGVADLTAVYVVRGGDLVVVPATGSGGAVVVTGVTEFSDWYPGIGGLDVLDWILLE